MLGESCIYYGINVSLRAAVSSCEGNAA